MSCWVRPCAEVLKRFPNHKSLENEDAIALAAPASNLYETLAVWFEAVRWCALWLSTRSSRTTRPT